MRFFATLLLAVCATPIFAQTWTLQTSGTTATLNDVHFISELNGWAVADANLLLATADGGATWTQQSLGGGELDLQGIAFNPSGTVGLIVTDAGSVYRTADGGLTWALLPTGMSDGRAAISWASNAIVWVGGRDGNAAVSTNAGATWTPRPTGSSERTEALAATSATSAWVANRSGQLRRTTTGTSWATVATGTGEDLKDIQMLDATTGYITAPSNTILKTTDGSTWTNVSSAGADGNGLHFLDASTGWVVGDAGEIWATANGGASWTLQASGTAQALNRVHFPSATRGWAVGDGGTIVAFGATGTSASAPNGLSGVSLVAPSPARGRLSVSLHLDAPTEVDVVVFDVLGREVNRLHTGGLGAGTHAFSATLAPGLYVVHARTPDGSLPRRVTVVE